MLEKEENDKVYCDKVYIPSPDFLWSGPVDTHDSGGGMEVKRRGLGLRFEKSLLITSWVEETLLNLESICKTEKTLPIYG